MNKRGIDGRAAAIAGVSGALFAIGLALGGMTRPSKVIGFLDVAGAWDASLAFVMGGALLVYSVGASRVRKWERPFFEKDFKIPDRRGVDASLLTGAVLFGIGWGTAGFCPGPALVSIASLQWEAFVFIAAMLTSMAAFRLLKKTRA